MRIATYSRCSSDLQDRRSIADQRRELHQYARSRGWKVAGDYADEGISGASTVNRPELRRLLADAEAHRFDLALTENLDRLAQRTRRGQAGRVKAGRIPGGKSYGHDVIMDGDERGKRAINEPEAAIVRRIYAEYADGRSPHAIVAELNREGIPSPRGGTWNASTLNGSRKRANGILSNRLYIGVITYNRQQFVKDPATGRRQARPNPRSSWMEQETPELRIVPQDLWDRAQARRREIQGQPLARRPRPKYLLSGRLRCSRCEGNYIVVGGKYLGCSSYRNKRTCDNSRMISMDEDVGRVLGALERHLLSPEAVAAGVEAYRHERLRLARDRARNEGALRRELDALDRSINRWLNAIGDGSVDARVISPKLNAAAARKDAIEALLRAAAKDDAAVLHPQAAERYRREVAQLRAALRAGGEKACRDVVELVRGMIQWIEVTPGRERMELTVIGDLASFLSREQESNNISSPLVAGVRFLHNRYILCRSWPDAQAPEMAKNG